jgi:hypothetical protein
VATWVGTGVFATAFAAAAGVLAVKRAFEMTFVVIAAKFTKGTALTALWRARICWREGWLATMPFVACRNRAARPADEFGFKFSSRATRNKLFRRAIPTTVGGKKRVL